MNKTSSTKTKLPDVSSKTARLIFGASDAAKKNYGHYPNVLGVGVGTKYSKGKNTPSGQVLSVQFYVRKKVKRLTRSKRLPRFIYARNPNGSIHYGRKVPTDVIELKNLRFACRSGTEIGVIGETGTLSLLFRNKIAGQNGTYLITCAHVAGDVRQSPPVDPGIESSCCTTNRFFATTLANSTQKNGTVEYDIALAQVLTDCLPQPELRVIGSTRILRRFLSAADIRPGMTLDCAFPRSNIPSATIASFRTSLPLALDGRTYQVQNLFLINQSPRPGDSGGLLYSGDEAVGILVGLSEGWGLFQPFEESFEFLKGISPVAIRCF
jgi:hypothetical protein